MCIIYTRHMHCTEYELYRKYTYCASDEALEWKEDSQGRVWLDRIRVGLPAIHFVILLYLTIIFK
jgi:hypothetical protein